MYQGGRGRGDRLRVNWQRIMAAFHHLLLRAVASSRGVSVLNDYCSSVCSRLHNGDCRRRSWGLGERGHYRGRISIGGRAVWGRSVADYGGR